VVSESASKNMFDDLPELAAPQLSDELERYLTGNTYPEHIPNVLAWWSERQRIYPCLSRMAMDYLSIPGLLPSPALLWHYLDRSNPNNYYISNICRRRTCVQQRANLAVTSPCSALRPVDACLGVCGRMEPDGTCQGQRCDGGHDAS
jgi:hypothetical protein